MLLKFLTKYFILLYQGGKEEHGRHRHRERMIPTFAGNTVGGSMWTLDYIKVRSGCSCEIMPKLKKKKKYKKSKPRDQDLDPETWDFRRIRTDCSTSEYAISLLKNIFYGPIEIHFESMKKLIKKRNEIYIRFSDRLKCYHNRKDYLSSKGWNVNIIVKSTQKLILFLAIHYWQQ